MSKQFLAVVLAAQLLSPLPLAAAPPVKVPDWVYRRFHPDTVKVRDVQGISEHIRDGKLYLNLKEFLELVLKNSTDVNLTRLDVYTAADQVEAAKAVYDPTLAFGFNTFRSVAPQASELSGADTLSNLTQNSFLNYQQSIASGQTFNGGFNAVRSSSNNSFNFLNPNLTGSLNLSGHPVLASEPHQHSTQRAN